MLVSSVSDARPSEKHPSDFRPVPYEGKARNHEGPAVTVQEGKVLQCSTGCVGMYDPFRRAERLFHGINRPIFAGQEIQEI